MKIHHFSFEIEFFYKYVFSIMINQHVWMSDIIYFTDTALKLQYYKALATLLALYIY